MQVKLNDNDNELKSDTGGVDDTVSDFWELCWQTGANVIVMLCSIQTGRLKICLEKFK